MCRASQVASTNRPAAACRRHMPAAGTCGVEARLVSNFVRFSAPLIRAAHWRSAMRCPCWRRARRPGQPPLVTGARAYTADFDARLPATSGGRAARTTPYLGRWCGYNFAMAAQQSRTTDHSLPARVRLMCTTAVDALRRRVSHVRQWSAQDDAYCPPSGVPSDTPWHLQLTRCGKAACLWV